MVFSSKALFIPSSWGVFTSFLQVLQKKNSLLSFFRQKQPDYLIKYYRNSFFRQNSGNKNERIMMTKSGLSHNDYYQTAEEVS